MTNRSLDHCMYSLRIKYLNTVSAINKIEMTLDLTSSVSFSQLQEAIVWKRSRPLLRPWHTRRWIVRRMCILLLQWLFRWQSWSQELMGVKRKQKLQQKHQPCLSQPCLHQPCLQECLPCHQECLQLPDRLVSQDGRTTTRTTRMKPVPGTLTCVLSCPNLQRHPLQLSQNRSPASCWISKSSPKSEKLKMFQRRPSRSVCGTMLYASWMPVILVWTLE